MSKYERDSEDLYQEPMNMQKLWMLNLKERRREVDENNELEI